uniref:P-type ATPase N-terminal domain-containing protein n=1 Tax=Leptobrachium leishanense TaxID=445787 RepID=A0A8C5P6M7_9ANUR
MFYPTLISPVRIIGTDVTLLFPSILLFDVLMAYFRNKKLIGNKKKKKIITTSKYNIITFIPLNLFEQFHRLANIYFLFIIILQVIPAISTVPWFAIMLPLLFLLVVRGVKDLIDDIVSISLYNLHLMSKKKSFCSEKWKDIQVGDIVRLQKDDFVPADLLLLYSLEPNSLCFVETADIDGETNLKFKQASMVTHKLLCTEESMAAFDGKVTCEESNSNMHSFTGTLEWNSEKYSLDNDHILLRGCRIRNTKTCYGLVIYAGVDSKIMKNCGKVRIKKTKLDLMMNKLVVIVSTSIVNTAGNVPGAKSWKQFDYISIQYPVNSSNKLFIVMKPGFSVTWCLFCRCSINCSQNKL